MKYLVVCPLKRGTNQTIKRLSEGAVLRLIKQSVLGFFFIDIFYNRIEREGRIRGNQTIVEVLL